MIKKTSIIIISLFLITLALIIPNTASAETGTISVSGEVVKMGDKSIGGALQSIQWNYLYLRNSTYNDFWYYRVTLPPNTYFDFGTNYTDFQCIENCTGSGTFIYTAADRNVTYYGFNILFTGSLIKIQFNDATVPTQIHNWYGSERLNTGTVSSLVDDNNPISFVSDSWLAMSYPSLGTDFRQYSKLGSFASAPYNVSYYSVIGDQYFSMIVDKSNAQLPLKIGAHGSEDEYYLDSAFNRNYTVINSQYLSGLYLNISLSNGATEEILINSTGVSGYIPPNPPPATDPITGVGIKFDADNYSIHGTANISWIRLAGTPFGYEDGIFITQPDATKKMLVLSPPDTGNMKTNDLPTTGTYKITFERSILGYYPGVLASDTATVNTPTAPWFLVDKTYYFNTSGNITYYQDISSSDSFFFYYWNEESQKYIPSGGTWGALSGQIANWSFKCGVAGKNKITFGDLEAYTDCIIDNTKAQHNITTSFINVSSNTPTIIDYLDVDYAISSISWINNQTYIKVFDNNNIETFSYSTTKQYGRIPFFLVQAPHEYNDMVVTPGTNTIKLVNNNGTVLDTETITVSEKSSEGYGLILDKKEYCTNEKIVFKYYSVDRINVTLWNSDGTLVAKHPLNGSLTGKKTFIIYSKPGIYDMKLMWNGIQYANDVFTIKNCDTAAGGGATTQPQTGTVIGDTIKYFIGLPAFWGLILWILAVYGVASNVKTGTDGSKAIELTAVIGAALEAVVGLWEPFTWWVVAIIIISLGSRFYAGRSAAGREQ